jgi:hypothetical protein
MDAITFFIYLSTGLAVIIAVVVTVYILTICFDKCTKSSTNYTLTPEELVERQHASNLTKRAGLAGILPEERSVIFRTFFNQHTLTYTPTPTNIEEDGIDNSETTTTSKSIEPSDDVDNIEDQKEASESSCPICLSEYGKLRLLVLFSVCYKSSVIFMGSLIMHIFRISPYLR